MASKYRTWPGKQPDETSDLGSELSGNPDILTRVCKKVLSNKKNTHAKRATKYGRVKRFVTAVSNYKIVVQF